MFFSLNAALYVLFLSLAVASLSLTITKAQVFGSLRSWVDSKNGFLGKLISCPYCASHWIGLVMVVYYQPVLVPSPILFFDLAISLFAVVTLSSFATGLIWRAFEGIE